MGMAGRVLGLRTFFSLVFWNSAWRQGCLSLFVTAALHDVKEVSRQFHDLSMETHLLVNCESLSPLSTSPKRLALKHTVHPRDTGGRHRQGLTPSWSPGPVGSK